MAVSSLEHVDSKETFVNKLREIEHDIRKNGILLQVKDEKAREWYEKEAHQQAQSVRTLQRNVYSQYYYHMLQTQKKDLVENEMKELTKEYQSNRNVKCNN